MTHLRPEATHSATDETSTDESTPGSMLNRRKVLCGLSLALLAPAVIAACGDDDDDDSSSAATGGTTQPTTSSSAGAASGLVALADVPVGGGTIVEGPDGPVLVVQPSAGQVKAFSAVCTHQGTTIRAPEGGVSTCPNHGSQFDATSGSVVRGPALDALSAVNVSVQGDQVVLV